MRRALAVVLAHLVAGTLLTLGLTSPASAQAAKEEVHPEWGSITAPDAVLRRGCKKYVYTYDINPPEGEWDLAVFIKGPSGKRVASGYWLYPDPKKATIEYRLCKAVTRYGRFSIRAKMTIQNGQELLEGWLPTSHFRMHRPRH